MKKLVIIFLVVIMIVAIGLVQADNSLDNDPNTNPDANACYEGGTLEGKCTTLLEWEAGWYLIRYEYRMIDTVPEFVIWVLPDNYIEDVIIAPAPTCYARPEGDWSFYIVAPSGTLNNLEFYHGSICEDGQQNGNLTGGEAPNLHDATVLCFNVMGEAAAGSSDNYGTTNWWICGGD